jgi:hypothetical protein
LRWIDQLDDVLDTTQFNERDHDERVAAHREAKNAAHRHADNKSPSTTTSIAQARSEPRSEPARASTPAQRAKSGHSTFVVQGTSSGDDDVLSETVVRVEELRVSCDKLSAALDRNAEHEARSQASSMAVTKGSRWCKTRSELAKRLLTGWALGGAVTVWIFSGNHGYALGLYLLALLAQLEYYRSVISTGVYPARRIGLVSTTAMYAAALWAPGLHEAVLPLAATSVMVWFLLFKKEPGTISEISSSIMGIFYVGFLPSFWVRSHSISQANELALPT